MIKKGFFWDLNILDLWCQHCKVLVLEFVQRLGRQIGMAGMVEFVINGATLYSLDLTRTFCYGFPPHIHGTEARGKWWNMSLSLNIHFSEGRRGRRSSTGGRGR